MHRTLASLAALAAFAAAPAFAQQDHANHHATQTAGAPSDQPTHEMCEKVMGRQMDGKPVHDHGRDKTGAATWPNGKPLSAAEMEQMHKRCAEKMKASAPK